jgi:hypothetical protein
MLLKFKRISILIRVVKAEHKAQGNIISVKDWTSMDSMMISSTLFATLKKYNQLLYVMEDQWTKENAQHRE